MKTAFTTSVLLWLSSFTLAKMATGLSKRFTGRIGKSGSRFWRFVLLCFVQLVCSPDQVFCAEECRLTPVFHVLQSPGCNPLTIPSFACVGKCTSYVQVSASKMWQIERSCMCCQESGEREATVTLQCPKASPGSSRVQKVITKAPVDCMCRPCTGVDEGSILPQEVAGYLESDGSPPSISVFPVRLQL